MIWFTLLSCTFSEPDFEPTAPHKTLGGSNMLIILMDDIGTDKVGVYKEHPAPANTPNLNAFADRGIRFTNAYAYPTCSPTRAALLTGRHGRRNGVGYNVRDRAKKGLPFDEELIPEMLKASNTSWTSAGVGKWHLTPRRRQSLEKIKKQGWNYYAGVLGNLPKSESYTRFTWHSDDGSSKLEAGTYLTTREVDEALQLMNTLPEPWFIYLALHAPHYPWANPPDSLLAAPARGATETAMYNAMVEAMDTELGRLFSAVDLNDTVLMVLGDNGDPDEVVQSPRSVKEAKNTFYEGAMNVPWIVAGPQIKSGTNDELISVLDIFPTVAEVAGVNPNRKGVGLDGKSLIPALLGEAHERQRYMLIEKYFTTSREPSWSALRDERYKLVRHSRQKTKLFDLKDRFDDGKNLAEGELTQEQRAAYNRLNQELDRQIEEMKSEGGCL